MATLLRRGFRMSNDDPMRRTLAGGWGLTPEDVAAVDLAAVERARFLDWLHTFSCGATPERLRAEVTRLQGLYNDGDLQEIIVALKTDLARPRRRRRTTMAWDMAEGIQTQQEIKAIWRSGGLSQIDACAKWQEQSGAIPVRRDWHFVRMEPESLKKKVFGR
jgi:hypothetical protein